MSKHKHELLAEEMPHNHTYQIILLVVFLSIWISDSFLLHFSTIFLFIIPIWYHLIPAIAIFFVAAYLIDVSHKDLFNTQEVGLITAGIFSRIRHPMYLGSVLGYLALAVGTISFASLLMCIVIFAAYNTMANYEEEKLEEKFGNLYIEYKKSVPKWFPRK